MSYLYIYSNSNKKSNINVKLFIVCKTVCYQTFRITDAMWNCLMNNAESTYFST